MLDRFEIARALREIEALLRLRGGNPFRAKAYGKGAAALEALATDLGTLVREGRLTELAGIGPALARIVTELHDSGRARLLDELRREFDPAILQLAQVPSLSLKKARVLREALGLTGVADLKQACETGRVRTVHGFGPATEARILAGIERLEKREDRIRLVDALEIADRLLDHVRANPRVSHAELAGAVRRREETVAEVTVVACAKDPGAALEELVRYPELASIEARRERAFSAKLASGLPVDVHVATEAEFARTLLRATGSLAHLERLDALARERGLSLAGLEGETEPALYGRLGLPWIAAELREDEGEIEAALAGDRFDDLVTLEDVRGAVHCHTTYSDGRDTIEDMALAAEARGFEFLTITDHSPTASYAGGVTLDRLERQWEEIARVQERVKIKILRGTESDVLANGDLDYPDAILEKMDVVIASVHSRMKMDEDEMTRRLVRAMRLPIFKIWGHALGRLILRRDPFKCRVEEVLDAIAESRGAIEVNGDPYRLDMEPRWIRKARERKIPFVISTDAHSVGGLDVLPFGVAMARRGGLRRGEVLNARGASAFAAVVKPAS